MEIYTGTSKKSSGIVVFSCYCGASPQKLPIAIIPELALFTN
jgi:hypothetical protein